ncbi:MAG: transcriptional regulator YeiL [Emergencia sp.]|nr:transcriptional regulator YeiL [Emergencia sp.]
MRIKNEKEVKKYLAEYPLQPLFSVPIEEDVELHVFRRGEFICEELMPPERLYFLVRGSARLYLIHEDGNVSVVQYYEAGDVLGELELLTVRSQSQTIQAAQDCVCLALPFSRCREKILQDPVFLRNLSRMIAEKMLRSVGKLAGIQNYPLENRLATHLLELDRLSGNDSLMKLKLTELSSYLGASYRHLSRVLKQFADSGWIEKDRNRIRITNKKALQEKAARMETE